ncbi:MAG TPA: tRNA (N6-isopentenyl adenosine(37)-C2)-methylthiotransferase MiaB [Actinomycetota bacterium]|nr:tRNA (N6-isopentenyl adenosine(37)-C2)-methylthiotransferase MiaB [Actinomycetota bacterium]
MERYLIRTFGCQMNEHDSERISGLLESRGLERTEEVDEAEVVVLNTCAVRENADNRLYGNLGHLRAAKEANPRLRIVVAGCLAQKDRGEIQRRAPWVDVVVGTHAVPYLADLLEWADREGPQMDVREYTELFPSALPARRAVAHAALVSVSTGCDNRCSFCIVPLVRGPQRSRPLGEVLAEVQGLAREGVVEVTLLGQNVNTYGRDLTIPDSPRRPLFARLLRAVNDVEGIERIRFTSPHPHDFTPDVVEAMAECEKVCEHIHFPLQSGSDRVLKAMRRSYRSARYLSWLELIREAIPGIAVTTDIIVGFPGETEEDFLGTLRVAEAARFDAAYTFQYSPRPGTQAATFEERVPKEVVQERFDRLVALQEGVSLAANRALEGSVQEVLVEGAGRKGGAQGRTRTNRVVNFAGPAQPGGFLDVRIMRGHPHHLSGEPAAVSAASR